MLSPPVAYRASPHQVLALEHYQTNSRLNGWRVYCVDVGGHLCAARIEERLARLTEQYEILRTRLSSHGSAELAQIINPPDSVAEGRVTVISDAVAGQFDCERYLAALPHPSELAVAAWLRQGENGTTRLWLAMSSLLLDGMSANILAHKAVASEPDEVPGHSSILQYADFAPWAWRQLNSSVAVTSEPADPVLPLANRPDEGRGQLEIRLSPADTGLIASGRAAVSPDSTRLWLAAYVVLLGKVGAKDAFRVDVSLPGRTEDALASNLGLFERQVAVGFQLDRSLRFVELLSVVQDQWCRAERDVHTMAGPTASAALRGVAFSHRRVPAFSSLVDVSEPSAPQMLSLTVIECGEEWVKLIWDYSKAYVSDHLAQSLHDGLLTMMRGALAQPDRRIADMGLLPARHAVIARGDQADEGFDIGLVRRIVAVARSKPMCVAIQGARQLTFAELEILSAKCASHLKELGVAKGDCVALVLPRSAEWIVLAVAILRLGASYAAFETHDPPARLTELLEALSPRLILTASPDLDVSNRQPADAAFWARVGAAEALAEELQPDLEKTAYVLHTSGSSGVPKPVAVSERSLVNYIEWARLAYSIDALDAAILHTSLAVDLTVTSLWLPLACGKTVVLADEQNPIAGLDGALHHDRSWLVKATPSHIRALNQLHAIRGSRPRLRGVMVLGGEQLNRADVDAWLQENPELAVYNEYGPTEATVGCIAASVSRAGPVLIGKPISNVDAYVSDNDGLPVPQEVPGELVIGGRCVAQGYLGQDPASGGFVLDSVLGGRAYRTGDRVCLRTDGRFEFLGRTDEEFKLRGFRIAPAEIERALLATHQIEAAAVARIHHEQQGEALVAYCVMSAGRNLEAVSLRRRLSELLPDHMLPNAMIQVEQIPLAPTGKRDIKSLLRRYPVRSVSFASYRSPVSPEEEILAAVWQSVLGIDRVGVDDNYFALGGDSLRSVQITALAEQRGLRFSLDLLHDNPTVRMLARAITEARSVADVEPSTPFSLLPDVDRPKLPNDVVDAYPLNLLQEGMIYHREFSPKSAVYHAICSYRIEAPFDLETMRMSMQDLVNRHPLLRTSFSLTKFSRPLQLVHREFPNPLQYEDISGLTGHSQQMQIDGWMESEKRRGFELEEFPLIRFMVHRMGDNLFQLTYSFHHEIIDGWSDALMVTELMTQYMSVINGRPIELKPPVSTFRDAVHLEQQALARPDFRAFWQNRLEDVSIMRLPNLRPAKVDIGERTIIKIDVPINQRLSDGVKAVARALAMPLKTVLLAAHVKVMSVIGNQDDVMTYTVGNGRPENRDGHAVIGLFVNSLAFRIQLRGGTWADLIYDTLRAEHELLPYRRFPMAELKRQHGSEPLSETLFFFNNYHVAEALEAWSNLKLLGLKVYAESTFPFCLNAYIEPFTHKLRLRMEYDRLQYTDELMDDVSDLYLHVLESMVKNVAIRHDVASLLAPKRQSQILSLGFGHEQSRQPGATILSLIEAQVAALPQSSALVCGDEDVTYSELASQSDRIAASLGRRGIGPGDIVAILMPRCVATVVAMLGVMKAGAAYLPLDHSQPPARVQYIINDAKASLVITLAPWAEPLEAPEASFAECLQEHSSPAPKPAAGVAYIIYTSGTTGRPKGVIVDHAALYHSTCARFDYYQKAPKAFLLLSSHAFDSSVAGIFWTLCGGGKIVIPENPERLDSSELWNVIERRKVSHLLCIPSLFAAMLEDPRSEDRRYALEAVIVAGEACPRDLGISHRTRLPDVELYNEYGPTEAAVWATVHRCEAVLQTATVPVGRPISNVSTFVLDRHLFPVSFGVLGELYIGGAGLALGYSGDAALTAERFIPNPYARNPGERLYRTGDIVNQSSDGVIHFIGRTDQLIKIQGFRVDLLEVERVLEQHPSVGRALVQVRSKEPLEKELVAYIIPTGRDTDVAELKAFSKRMLPKYMIPSSFVRIDHIPLKQSGKIDYAALPAPVREEADPQRPATSTEEVLVDIWKSVLGLEEIGVNQDFMELGGESLRALRLISKVRRAFDVGLPLRSIVADSITIAKMAQAVDRERRERAVANSEGAVASGT